MPTSSKKKRKKSPKLSALTIIKKGITLPSIFRKKIQKTSICLNNLYIDDYS